MSEEQLSFEALLERLQSMVTQLESEDLGLEASLKLYEEGVRLSLRGQEVLEGAEAKVVELQKLLHEERE
ncbi:MAG: exodeoxyribonuclease VII small subunit [Bradymonadia bacterium]